MYSLVQLKELCTKSLHFVAFFQLWKKPNIKSQNIFSLHLKNEIDLEKMLND